ncbi:MAG: polysaccharide deacetylase family protein [Steroidobacteraceae bacterium]|nr:polysaccharide deacetylase family protein [Steroidobacteraceae bacterium]
MAAPSFVDRAEAPALRVVLRCAERHRRRARYAFDTLLMAAGVPVEYGTVPARDGLTLVYSAAQDVPGVDERRTLILSHVPAAWERLDGRTDPDRLATVDGLPVVLPEAGTERADVSFDLPANAFYFLSSWSERRARGANGARALYADSVYARLGVPQDVVDRYLGALLAQLARVAERAGLAWPAPARWPGGATHAVVLSHDVDFLPVRPLVDSAVQGAKTLARHLVRQRDPASAARAVAGLLGAALRGRDPYGCVPELIARESALGVRASIQVAVARRHPRDVNYSVEDPRVAAYLRVVRDSGFDLCLHGSYRSTEAPGWYEAEVERLASALGRPEGSRQHYLAFDYDALFRAQERAGIRYDMSVGYPDHPGPRAGFSFPYFPYSLAEDRPYDVVEIGLVLMDVTLQSYLRLDARRAWGTIEACLADLAAKGGAASVVWHPIVFGNARDPGYGELWWRLVDAVRAAGGAATDGRTVNAWWRARACAYPSFAPAARAA